MNKHGRHILAGSLAILGLLITAVIPLTAFEAHVINVTATISREPCERLEIRSMGFWKTHAELWILPQTLGAETISTPTQVAQVFKDYPKSFRNKLRGQLLALKFNVAYFHVGPALVPLEDITIHELVAQADALLQRTPPATPTELARMIIRVERTNNAGSCLVCP